MLHRVVVKCPRCQKPLVAFQHDVGGRVLDAQRCPECDGHWFEAADLKAIEDTVEVVLLSWIHLPGHETQARTLLCPRCQPATVMKKVLNEHDTRVVMDVCGNCHGAWLDYGELEAITRRNVFSAIVDAVRFIKKN